MTEHKIYSRESITEQVQKWQAEGKEIVFTNGCFDIVHLGHIDYLEKARGLGDKLVLGLNTDASVRRLKGETRPVVNEYARSRMMAAFEFVDAVVLFDEPTPLELIQTVKPDVLVKGDDYSLETIVGADFVIAKGGNVKTIPLVKGYSTTSLIEKIKLI
ncbi:MAG: D-glycero-beta-D-manno-heptose 1-phosphate adenylyltransferase [Arcicella sp.]|jgi:D-glycero-beta-D-manno-heptose 1-phosphate adenylyltransferase|nr:D-glycero-beta-D-manno-heptose 1-phosphate adenylyltransferase [Arcicella sp.]